MTPTSIQEDPIVDSVMLHIPGGEETLPPSIRSRLDDVKAYVELVHTEDTGDQRKRLVSLVNLAAKITNMPHSIVYNMMYARVAAEFSECPIAESGPNKPIEYLLDRMEPDASRFAEEYLIQCISEGFLV